MAIGLSADAKKKLFAQESNDPFLLLTEMTHKDWKDEHGQAYTVRLVANNEDVIHNGLLYSAAIVEAVLPTDDGKKEAQAELIIDNIDIELIDEFREITTPIGVTFKLVFASDPNKIELEYANLKLVGINYDAARITCKLMFNDVLNLSFPSYVYNPSEFPGMF